MRAPRDITTNVDLKSAVKRGALLTTSLLMALLASPSAFEKQDQIASAGRPRPPGPRCAENQTVQVAPFLAQLCVKIRKLDANVSILVQILGELWCCELREFFANVFILVQLWVRKVAALGTPRAMGLVPDRICVRRRMWSESSPRGRLLTNPQEGPS